MKVNDSGQFQTKPFMWVSQGEGDQQIKYFNSLKLELMSRNARLPVGTLLNNNFFLGNFWGMIEYFDTTYKDKFSFLHVYFGIDPNTKLVLIFEPAESETESSNLGYFYLPKKFDATNIKGFKVLPSDKKSWTDRFVNAMALSTIGLHHSDNQYPDDSDPRKIPSDTRSVTYCADDLRELALVKGYFSKEFPISDDFSGNLGSYSLDGVPRGKFKGRYINRILLQFDLLDKGGHPFYLDSIPEFMKLDDSDGSSCPELVDNGQLCPTNCPKGG